MASIEITEHPLGPQIFTPAASQFVADLVRRFRDERTQLLIARADRQADLAKGHRPDFLDETAELRSENWTGVPPAQDLCDRRVEITGPTDRKMMINALNSGAKVFMAVTTC